MTRFIGFDLETTGLDVETAQIVTAATVVKRMGDPEYSRSFEYMAAVTIPESATAIHGITTEHALTHGMPEISVVDYAVADLHDQLTDEYIAPAILVGMNTIYDLTILDRRANGNAIDTLCDALDGCPPRVWDIYLIDLLIRPGNLGRRRLRELVEHWTGEPADEFDKRAHGAIADAKASVDVAIEQYRYLAGQTRDTLTIDMSVMLTSQRNLYQDRTARFNLINMFHGVPGRCMCWPVCHPGKHEKATDFSWPEGTRPTAPTWDDVPTRRK